MTPFSSRRKFFLIGLVTLLGLVGFSLMFRYTLEPLYELASAGGLIVWSPIRSASPVPRAVPTKLALPSVRKSPHPLAAGESIGIPVRIRIPVIKVDAFVEKVGKTAAGAMDVPKVPANAGWLTVNPRPGQEGSAVIDGHVNWYRGVVGVFANLRKVRPGDEVFVQDENGAIISFVVRESKLYDPNANASDIFSSGDGLAHLNLITCDGVWDRVAKAYTKRLIVFTDRKVE